MDLMLRQAGLTPAPEGINFILAEDSYSNYDEIMSTIVQEHIDENRDVMTPRTFRRYLLAAYDNIEDVVVEKLNEDEDGDVGSDDDGLDDDDAVDPETGEPLTLSLENTARPMSEDSVSKLLRRSRARARRMRRKRDAEMLRQIALNDQVSEELAGARVEFVNTVGILFHKMLKDGIDFSMKQEKERHWMAQNRSKLKGQLSALHDERIPEEVRDHIIHQTQQIASRDDFIERLERRTVAMSQKVEVTRLQLDTMRRTFEGFSRSDVEDMKTKLSYYEQEREYLYSRLAGTGDGTDNKRSMEKIFSKIQNDAEKKIANLVSSPRTGVSRVEVQAAVEKAQFKMKDKLAWERKQRYSLRRKLEAQEQKVFEMFDPFRPERITSRTHMLVAEDMLCDREEMLNYVLGGKEERNRSEEYIVEATIGQTADLMEVIGGYLTAVGPAFESYTKGRKKESTSTIIDMQHEFVEHRDRYFDNLRYAIEAMREKNKRPQKAVQAPDVEIRRTFYVDKTTTAGTSRSALNSAASTSSRMTSKSGKSGVPTLKRLASIRSTSSRRASMESDVLSARSGISSISTNSYTIPPTVEQAWKQATVAVSRIMKSVRDTLHIAQEEVELYENFDELEGEGMTLAMKQMTSTLNAHRIVLENIRLPFDVLEAKANAASPASDALGQEVDSVLSGSVASSDEATRSRRMSSVDDTAERARKAQLRAVEAKMFAVSERLERLQKQPLLRNKSQQDLAQLAEEKKRQVAEAEKQLSELTSQATTLKEEISDAERLRAALLEGDLEAAQLLAHRNSIDLSTLLSGADGTGAAGLGVSHKSIERLAVVRGELIKARTDKLAKDLEEAKSSGNDAEIQRLETKLKEATELKANIETQQQTMAQELLAVPELPKFDINGSSASKVGFNEAENTADATDEPIVTKPKSRKRASFQEPDSPTKPDKEVSDENKKKEDDGDEGEDEEEEEDEAKRIQEEIIANAVPIRFVLCATCYAHMKCSECGTAKVLAPRKHLEAFVQGLQKVFQATRRISLTNMRLVKENVSLRRLQQKYNHDPNSIAVLNMLERGQRMKAKWEERKRMLQQQRQQAFFKSTEAFADMVRPPAIPSPPRPLSYAQQPHMNSLDPSVANILGTSYLPPLASILSAPGRSSLMAAHTSYIARTSMASHYSSTTNSARGVIDVTRPMSYQQFMRLQTGQLQSGVGQPNPGDRSPRGLFPHLAAKDHELRKELEASLGEVKGKTFGVPPSLQDSHQQDGKPLSIAAASSALKKRMSMSTNHRPGHFNKLLGDVASIQGRIRQTLSEANTNGSPMATPRRRSLLGGEAQAAEAIGEMRRTYSLRLGGAGQSPKMLPLGTNTSKPSSSTGGSRSRTPVTTTNITNNNNNTTTPQRPLIPPILPPVSTHTPDVRSLYVKPTANPTATTGPGVEKDSPAAPLSMPSFLSLEQQKLKADQNKSNKTSSSAKAAREDGADEKRPDETPTFLKKLIASESGWTQS